MLEKVFKDERKKEYLNAEGADKPLISPIPHETLVRARGYRQTRMREQLDKHDCVALLLYDPLNTRYALDSSNMQLWATHNAFRYAMIINGGPAIDFQYDGAEHLNAGFETIDETRTATTWFYMASGSRTTEFVNIWADEIADLVREYGGGNKRLATDSLHPEGVVALQRRGIEIVNGQELCEHARSIKSADELELMGWTIRVAEAGMARMYENSLPGKTENEIWAELHYENIRSGGEWLETRLLAIGERTNPWFQECSHHVGKAGDILSFDTDMVGPYGYCADVSRSWTIGHTRMDNKQRELYSAALDQINQNVGIIRAGMDFREFNERAWQIPERFQANRYSCALHGVGLCDEWPFIPLHPDFGKGYEGVLEENMVVCVESLIGEEGGKECMKLETQVVVERDGARRLDTFPWEEI